MMVLLANTSIEPIITVYVGAARHGMDGVRVHAGRVAALGALADRIGRWNVIIGCLPRTALAMLLQASVVHSRRLAGLRVVMGMSPAGLLPSIG